MVGLLVIGGGPAGHHAAASYRRAGGTGAVLLLSADQHRPYDRPPLSKDYLRGELRESELPLEPRRFYRERDIEVRVDDRVVELDLDGSRVRSGSGEWFGYERCVIATGCRPASLKVPGAEQPEVLQLRSLEQARRLAGAATRARTAVVVGSGFIGCEAAASLALRGLSVTVVSDEERPQARRLGEAMASRLSGWLVGLGVVLRGGQEVARFGQSGRGVVLASGEEVAGDLVLCAPGVEPCSEVMEQAGITLQDSRVPVDERMRTGIPDVYAAGDVALAHNAAAGRRLRVEHWGDAVRMGEVAGANAAGREDAWAEVPGFWSTIGRRTVKYSAWGDGFDRDVVVEHSGGGFTVWYSRSGRCVGVLTHEADDDYERGKDLIANGRPPP